MVTENKIKAQKVIRLQEKELKQMIIESVRKVLREEKDNTFLQIKNDAKRAFDSVDKMGLPINLEIGRNENNQIAIMANLDPKFINSDELYNKFRQVAKEMKRAGFELMVGPAMGWCEWEYNDDRLLAMQNKANQRMMNRMEW